MTGLRSARLDASDRGEYRRDGRLVNVAACGSAQSIAGRRAAARLVSGAAAAGATTTSPVTSSRSRPSGAEPGVQQARSLQRRLQAGAVGGRDVVQEVHDLPQRRAGPVRRGRRRRGCGASAGASWPPCSRRAISAASAERSASARVRRPSTSATRRFRCAAWTRPASSARRAIGFGPSSVVDPQPQLGHGRVAVGQARSRRSARSRTPRRRPGIRRVPATASDEAAARSAAAVALTRGHVRQRHARRRGSARPSQKPCAASAAR